MANPNEGPVNLIRYAVIGMAVFVIAGLAGFGYWYTAQNEAAAEADADGDYQLLARPSPDTGDVITVREFFSYACGHCNNFEPVLAKWEEGIEDDVKVVKSALGGNRIWAALARAHYAMIELDMLDRGHLSLFNGIHEQRLPLTNAKNIAEYLADDEVSVRTFYKTATKSEGVEKAYDDTLQLAARFGVNSVPTLVVAGKYLVTTEKGTRYALKVVDDLIEKERKLR